MKRYSNLYDSITFDDFIDVYKEVRSNTKNKNKVKKFDDFYSVNMLRLIIYLKVKNIR